MKRYSNLLFDLDGTLTDPAEGITKSVAYALSRFGFEVKNLSSLNKFIGPPLKGSFMEFYGLTEKDALLGVNYYRERYNTIGWRENRVYEGVPKLLSRLREAGLRLILATSKPTGVSQQILQHFELEPYFGFLAGASLDESRTQKGEVIAYALETCKIQNRAETVMIGDRMHDVYGAKQNKIDSVGVLYGYGSREELEGAGADEIVQTVRELKELFCNN